MTLTKKKLKGGAQKAPKTPKTPKPPKASGRVGKFFKNIFGKSGKSTTSKASTVNVTRLQTVRLGPGASLATTQPQKRVTLSANHRNNGTAVYSNLNSKTRRSPAPNTTSNVYSVLKRPEYEIVDGDTFNKESIAATNRSLPLNFVASKYGYGELLPIKPSHYANPNPGPLSSAYANPKPGPLPSAYANPNPGPVPVYSSPQKKYNPEPKLPPKLFSPVSGSTGTDYPVINVEGIMGVKLQTYRSPPLSQIIQSNKTINLVIPSSSPSHPIRNRSNRVAIRRVAPTPPVNPVDVGINPSYESISQPPTPPKPSTPQSIPTFQMITKQSQRIQQIIDKQKAQASGPFARKVENPLYNSNS